MCHQEQQLHQQHQQSTNRKNSYIYFHYGLVVQFYYYDDDHGQCHPVANPHTGEHTRNTTQLLKQHPPKRSLTLVYGQRNGLPTTKTHNTFCHQNTQPQTQIQTSEPSRCMICSQSIQKCITHQTPHTHTPSSPPQLSFPGEKHRTIPSYKTAFVRGAASLMQKLGNLQPNSLHHSFSLGLCLEPHG